MEGPPQPGADSMGLRVGKIHILATELAAEAWRVLVTPDSTELGNITQKLDSHIMFIGCRLCASCTSPGMEHRPLI